MKNKKLISVFIIIAMLMSSVTLASAQEEKNLATNRAEVLYQLKLFLGVSTETFEANLQGPTNSAAAIVMVSRVLNWANDKGWEDVAKSGFYDVPDWAQAHVAFAVNKEITLGIGNNLFGNDLPVTQRQLQTWFDRALGKGNTWTQNEYLDDQRPLIRADLVNISWKSLQEIPKGHNKAIIETIFEYDIEKLFIAMKNDLIPITSESSVLPGLFFSGSTKGMSKNKTKDLLVRYKSDDMSFDGVASVKWQGTSSLAYPKKNYTIKLYTDASKEGALEKDFNGWGQENKYCLKANYMDHSHARNVVSAKIWGEIVATRDNIPPLLQSSPNYGAIDGFPVEVFYNGVCEGLYTFNIPKDGWMADMDKNNPNHAILSGEAQDGATAFRELPLIDGSDWDLEFPDVLAPNIKNSFNNAFVFLQKEPDTNFKNNFEKYFDLEACIDYWIYSYVMCHNDGLGKNMLMMTYDGVKWMPSMYDMDSTWGIWHTGESFLPHTHIMPESYLCSNSLLWERLEDYYLEDIKERYWELRGGVLSLGNLVGKFEIFMGSIPLSLYQEDVKIYPGIPSSNKNHLKQITDYIAKRLVYVDGKLQKSGKSKNLFVPRNLSLNYLLDPVIGYPIEHCDNRVSDFIPATPYTDYVFGNCKNWVTMSFFDADKKFISGKGGLGKCTGEAPEKTAFIRLSYQHSEATPQLEIGKTPTDYQPAYGN